MQQSPARRSRAAAFTTAAAMAAIFAIPGAASAAVSTTTVTAPAPDSVFDLKLEDLSGGFGGIDPVAVTGVAPGAADGDELWLGCSLTVNGLGVFVPLSSGPVEVEGQAFSGEIVPPPVTCRVRAVPLDEDDGTYAFLKTDAELAPYAGPRALGGAYLKQSSSIDTDERGAAARADDPTAVDFFVNARGQGRGFAATSGFGLPGGGTGGFGIFGGLLATAPIDDTAWRLLLGPSGGLGGFGAIGEGDPTDLSKYGLVVDGAPALIFPVLGDQRAKVTSRTVDPTTGDTTIVESTPVAKVVLDGGSGDFAESGVRIERTTTQDKEGRQITFSDVFRSTDGAAHRVEARYNASAISAFFSGGGTIPEIPEGELPDDLAELLGEIQTEPASFRIPWATGDEYRVPAVGETFGPAPAGRTTIWVHGPRLDLAKVGELIENPPTGTTVSRPSAPSAPAAARADGAEVPRGEGAITFDDAPSNVKFLSRGSFVANFVRDVPAGGTASVKHTYSQDLTPESLKELVDGPTVVPPVEEPKPPIAVDTPLPTQPAPVPPIPSIPGLPAPVNPLPKLSKSTGKVLISKAQGRKLRDRKPVSVTTKGMPAGRYGITIRRWVVNGKTIASGVKTIKKDGDLKVQLRLTTYGRWYLGLKRTRERKSVKVRVIVTWTPPGKGRQKQKTSYLTNFR